MPACTGDIPLSMRMYIFSVITMASSTTSPMESTTASIVSTLMENPATYITKNAPIIDMGITTTGTSVTLQSRRKTNMMNTTSRKATKMVSCTSFIDARMNCVLS